MDRRLFFKKALLGAGGFAIANSIISCMAEDGLEGNSVLTGNLNAVLNENYGKEGSIYVVTQNENITYSSFAVKRKGNVLAKFITLGYIEKNEKVKFLVVNPEKIYIRQLSDQYSIVEYKKPLEIVLTDHIENNTFSYIYDYQLQTPKIGSINTFKR
ncbi:hypothetical protein [Elizabethkingia anophelis]|uniref:hypothetical protein n=1 Tax=Elizabethkingia anophelis TaxID=1117645 RepID=UPI000D040459|nr:hypothetical protein [Elizabethkingia anophelis]MYY46418.1 hypothetical protein [Elizabethkingia anophelis]PRQ84154.1 hypothetical protein CMT86_18090 [Elizabethkingia anophelis]PRQ85054.1 hypothetical protein CMT87_02540 [Elizabethkingia anophelis]